MPFDSLNESKRKVTVTILHPLVFVKPPSKNTQNISKNIIAITLAMKRRMGCNSARKAPNQLEDDNDVKKTTVSSGSTTTMICLGVFVFISCGLFLAKKSFAGDMLASAVLKPPGFCGTTNRCQPLDITKSFSFVHISKCAGSSWMTEMKKLLPRLQPKRSSGEEYTVEYTRQNLPSDYMLVLLKSPRHHVWSMFSQCKYSPYGLENTAGTGFPRSGQTPASDVEDFEKWLSHFDANWPNPQSDHCFKCYDPTNYQSQHLAGTGKDQRCRPSAVEPNAKTVADNYWGMDWVGLSEFYHESKCLLFFRILEGGGGSELLTKTTPGGEDVSEMLDRMRAYTTEECVCPKPAKNQDVHFVHHKLGRRSTLHNLPPDVLQRVQRLTMADTAIYKLALLQFFNEVAYTENYRVGHRFLCDATLQEQEPRLLYTGINTTKSYYKSKQELATTQRLRQRRE